MLASYSNLAFTTTATPVVTRTRTVGQFLRRCEGVCGILHGIVKAVKPFFSVPVPVQAVPLLSVIEDMVHQRHGGVNARIVPATVKLIWTAREREEFTLISESIMAAGL